MTCCQCDSHGVNRDAAGEGVYDLLGVRPVRGDNSIIASERALNDGDVDGVCEPRPADESADCSGASLVEHLDFAPFQES